MVGFLLISVVPAAGQPADCPRDAAPRVELPLALDLAGRPGAPPGVTGQALLGVPFGAAGLDCSEPAAEPADTLGGEPGNVLRGAPSHDLLRSPGRKRVRIEPE